jgi:hypothetical protein
MTPSGHLFSAAAPFGLSTAPALFTAVTQPPVHLVRRLGIPILHYLVDFLLGGSTKAEARDNLELVSLLFSALEWALHPSKCVLEPAQTVEHRGFRTDLSRGRFHLETSRVLDTLVTKFEDEGRGNGDHPQVSLDILRRIAGEVVAFYPALARARELLQSLLAGQRGTHQAAE